ncbi:MAG TPA: sigma-70 family RNA polymerase sigma factor [Streptosporangiaceae bacterium]
MAASTDGPVLAPQPDALEEYRRELTGYCYRMLGSGFEADDAVQETMLRAWKAADRFEGRSSVRSWLYRIATNVCLDMLRGRQRRARPMELGPSSGPDPGNLGQQLPEHLWVSPIADDRVLPAEADPAVIVEARDTIRLAFVTALQHLPPRQRAALILCEVLRWQAAEAADLLGTSVPAVNSALQRARTTLASLPEQDRAAGVPGQHAGLLDKYVDAFERYDMPALVSLLHEDAVQNMPPYALWIEGAENIATWMVQPGPDACRGSRLVPVAVNGVAGFGQYRPDPSGGFAPWSLQVIEIAGDRIARMTMFLDTEALFPAFGLPDHLPA